MATPVSGVNRWLTLRWGLPRPGERIQPGKPILFDQDSENEALHMVEWGHYAIETTDEAPRGLTIWIGEDRLETKVYGFWVWQANDYAGLYRFEIQTATGEHYHTNLRIFPSKMLVPAYTRMKQELSEIALDLLLRLDSPSRERAVYGPKNEETSALHDYIQVVGIMDELRDIMSKLRRNPMPVLRRQSVQQDWQHIPYFSADTIPLPGNYQVAPALLAKRGVPSLPGAWITQEDRLTYDTYENRLLKRFLQKQLMAKLLVIEKRAEREEEQLADHCARYKTDDNAGDLLKKMRHALGICQQLKERCLRWSSEPFLKEVQPLPHDGKATQILLKDPTYSRFYRLYLRFQQHLRITRNAQQFVEELSLKKMSALYELWSVFTLSRMAIDELTIAGYRIISNSTFYEIEKNYFQFDVKKDEASIILAKGDLRVKFKYEPIYPNLSERPDTSALVATVGGNNNQKPDLAIEVYQGDQPRALLIFDPKYKRVKVNGRSYPEEKDLDKIRSYLTTIAYQRYRVKGGGQPSTTLERIVRSSYILYPGKELWQDPLDPNTGALPLTPGMAQYRLNEVRGVLKQLLQGASLL